MDEEKPKKYEFPWHNQQDNEIVNWNVEREIMKAVGIINSQLDYLIDVIEKFCSQYNNEP